MVQIKRPGGQARASSRSAAAVGLKQRPKTSGAQLARRHARTSLLALAAALVLLGAVGLGAVMGVNAERRDMVGKLGAIRPVQTAVNYFRSFGDSPERLVIDIKHRHYEKIREARDKAVARGQITSDLKEYIPATIRYGDRVYDAKLRLKGEWVDHVTSDKWSFAIRLKRGEALDGMTEFSVQHPRTRAYINEWVYHRALEREDVPGLRYRFVSVTINGRDHGVYALEERLSKQTVELHHHRRQGVIVRFDADYVYAPHPHVRGVMDRDFEIDIQGETSAALMVYDEEDFADSDPGLARQAAVARNLLSAFRMGRLETHQVFDVDKLAMYFALSELNGSIVTIDDWSDKRFLYNPVSSRLEPIGLEGAHETLLQLLGGRFNGTTPDPDRFHMRIFSDPVFYRRYVAALDRVSDPEYVRELFDDIGAELDRQIRFIQRESPHRGFDREEIHRNARFIRASLRPRDGMRAYRLAAAPGRCTLEMASIQQFPIELVGVASAEGVRLSALDHTLPGKPIGGLPVYEPVSFEIAAGGDCAQASVIEYRLLGLEDTREAEIVAGVRFDDTVLASGLLRLSSNVEAFDWLDVDEEARTLSARPGRWRIDRPLIVPEGYVLQLGPGVEIDLGSGASILSRSPVAWRGTEEVPVVIESSDGTGQGVFVTKASQRSYLQHVVFRNLSAPAKDGWELTGAVTFHRSPVAIDGVEFLDNRSEDSLNLIQTEFTMKGTHFRGAPSDAFDGDFVSGRIETSSFLEIAGDAIDFSGSRIEVDRLRMRNVADKAVSAGEQTELAGGRIDVEGAGIGVAAKDLSQVDLTQVQVRQSWVGIAAFQKKKEFGPGSVRVRGYVGEGLELPRLIEFGSSAEVDGEVFAGDRGDVKALIYGAEG
jgi:hypothetical protein